MTRRNLAFAEEEPWRPPAHSSPAGRLGRLRAAGRRALDLQAASVWRDLRELLPAARGTVVDVGAGAQPYRGLFGPSVSYRAIDRADARDRFGYEVPDTTYFAGDVWPLEDASADVLLATETLEHVVDPRGFLGEAHRCLRPDGRLVITVPFAARWHYVPHDYWRFTPSSLRLLLEESGFGDVHVQARGNAFTVATYKGIGLVSPLLLPQRGAAAVRLGGFVVGLALLPLALLAAAAAHLSLRWDGRADCLGWTATAVRR
jgi:SAM-dependent methyltransferase